ncbi:MAG: hypothetical protein ACXW24_01205 [Telluria sp.]
MQLIVLVLELADHDPVGVDSVATAECGASRSNVEHAAAGEQERMQEVVARPRYAADISGFVQRRCEAVGTAEGAEVPERSVR